MNQATRRKIRHFLHFLIILVVIFIQITLPLGALVTAIQPTPQMAQQAARQMGLGEWLTQRATDLVAWGQPLWGQPKRAAAQTAAPGGVTANLAAWYKADGTVGATQWDDASGNGKHMLAAGDGTAARMPTLDATPGSANNFNPRVAFLSNADANRKWTMTAAGNNVFTTTTTPGTIFNVSSFPDETIYDVPQMYAFEDDDPGLNLVTDRNAANDIRVIFQRDNGGTGSAGWDFAVPGVSQTQPLLTAHAWNYAAGGNTFTFNGYDYTPSSNPFIGATSPRYIFGSELTVAAGEAHSGYTSENIVYSIDWPSNSDERKRINSYLAIKYGITLLGTGTLAGGAADATFGGTADYLDSASTIIWSGAITNSAYHNNVAGIGRDDASALIQKQSTSINSGFQPVIGLGTIAASNADNSNTFAADNAFMVWGSNNLTATYGVSYSPTSFTPAAGYYRMARVWKIQETGTITHVVVQATGADHLLVSSDPTFVSGVTEIDMSSGSATVDFTDGQYFTFGTEQIAPGGVATDLAFWYRPEAGVTLSSDKVSSWVDQANGIELTPAAANNGPTYYDAGPDLINFNPVLNFSSVTRQDGLRAASGLPAIPNGVSTFSVLLPDDASARWFLHWGVFGSGYYNNYGACSANNPGVWTNSHGGCVNNPTALGPITTPSFLSVRWNSTAGTNQWQLRRNGQLHSGTTTATALNVPADTALEIGDVNNRTAGNEYVGNISEVIGYTSRLSDTDRQKVESYLSIKYGITYMNDANTGASNYLNSAGVTLWDATANSAYSANIAGIGRDDASELIQKQSKSVNSGFQPTIGLGTIVASNAANSSTFAANQSFLLWGDNNGAFTLTAAYNGGSNNRLARVWKIQETGAVGAVKVILPRAVIPGAGLRSLIVHSSDGAFGTVDRTYLLTTNGGNYEAAVDFNNGDFFTFSSSSTLPEIDVTPTTIDFGEVNTGSTAPAQAVTIQNPGDVSLSISNISLSGADAARFAISSNNCGASLSAGASCTVQITFSPTASGSRSALLVITSNDSDESTVNVALSGTTPGSGGGDTGTYNLAVTKSASVSNATVGTPFTYTITVLNKGTTAASNVVMTDQLPAGVAFGSVNATGGGNCTENSGVVTCTWAALAGGATATVTIMVTP